MQDFALTLEWPTSHFDCFKFSKRCKERTCCTKDSIFLDFYFFRVIIIFIHKYIKCLIYFSDKTTIYRESPTSHIDWYLYFMLVQDSTSMNTGLDGRLPTSSIELLRVVTSSDDCGYISITQVFNSTQLTNNEWGCLLEHKRTDFRRKK